MFHLKSLAGHFHPGDEVAQRISLREAVRVLFVGYGVSHAILESGDGPDHVDSWFLRSDKFHFFGRSSATTGRASFVETLLGDWAFTKHENLLLETGVSIIIPGVKFDLSHVDRLTGTNLVVS